MCSVYPVAAPGALIGASNFFELAVATAIALFGAESGPECSSRFPSCYRSAACVIEPEAGLARYEATDSVPLYRKLGF